MRQVTRDSWIAEQIVLTTSTSEGYSFVFRLLCNAGDELLVPKPSYPLFEFLADLQDVKLVPYPLIYDHGWQMDFPSLEKAVTERTRGVVVVHPNNPTGSYVKAGEVGLLNSFCREHGLAVIADEVFLDYGLETSGAKPVKRLDRSAESAAPPKATPASHSKFAQPRAVRVRLLHRQTAGPSTRRWIGIRRSTGLVGMTNGRVGELCGESGGVDVYAERAVEGGGVAADESGVGGDQRAAGVGGGRRWGGWK